MTVQTTQRIATFTKPFVLGDFDEVLPAGSYCVEADEVLLEGVSFPAYRRTSTIFHLPSVPGHPRHSRKLAIHPDDLDAALRRDRETEGEIPPAI